MNVVACN